jgi:hypothetical protein
MVPNFALLLTFDGISLLRQTAQGWANLSDVPLDNDDLTGAVIALREQAQALDPTGAQVALVIPNEQIRYLDIPEPAGRPRAKNRAVREALDGATPYEVDELVFDHVPMGRQRMIAAVAKETLEEAEAFVRQHGFDPVSFLALPPEGAFDGPVFFGSPVSWLGPEPTRPEGAFTIYPADAEALTPLGVKTAVHEVPAEVEETDLSVDDHPDVTAAHDAAHDMVETERSDTSTDVQPVATPVVDPKPVLSAQTSQVAASASETPYTQEAVEPSHDGPASTPEPAPAGEPDHAAIAPVEEAALQNSAPDTAETGEPEPVEQRTAAFTPQDRDVSTQATTPTVDTEQPAQQTFLDELEDLDSTLGAGLDDVEFENKLAAALGEENTDDTSTSRAPAGPSSTSEVSAATEAVPSSQPLDHGQPDHAAASAPQEQTPALTVAAPEPEPAAPKSFSDVFSTTPPEQTSPTLDFSEMRARRDAVPPAPKPLELSPQSDRPQAPVAPTPPKTPGIAPTPVAKPTVQASRHLSAERPDRVQSPTPAAPVPAAPKAEQPASGMTPLARIKPVKRLFQLMSSLRTILWRESPQPQPNPHKSKKTSCRAL